MLLTITTTQPPATDLGYLLHKHPARCQPFELSFGQAHVFYPEATEERCTAALLLDVDPVGLVRQRGQQAGYLAQQRFYPYLPQVGEVLVALLTTLGAVAFVLALINLVRVHRRRKRRIW